MLQCPSRMDRFEQSSSPHQRASRARWSGDSLGDVRPRMLEKDVRPSRLSESAHTHLSGSTYMILGKLRQATHISSLSSGHLVKTMIREAKI